MYSVLNKGGPLKPHVHIVSVIDKDKVYCVMSHLLCPSHGWCHRQVLSSKTTCIVSVSYKGCPIYTLSGKGPLLFTEGTGQRFREIRRCDFYCP